MVWTYQPLGPSPSTDGPTTSAQSAAVSANAGASNWNSVPQNSAGPYVYAGPGTTYLTQQTGGPAVPGAAIGKIAAPTDKIRILSWAEYEAEAANSTDFFWDGMIPSGGSVFLVAEPLTGKSALCAVLASAAHPSAATTEVAGLEVEERRFLFAMLEHGSDLKDYVRRASKSFGVQCIDHRLIRELDLGDLETVKELDAKASALGADVLVIDCLRRATLLDENVSGDMADVGAALRLLARNGTRLVIVIHHLGKDGSVRGSTDLTAQADSVVSLRKRGADIEIQARHHGAAEKTILVRFDFSNDGLSLVCVNTPAGAATSAASKNDVLDAIFNAVNSGHKSATSIRKETRRLLKAARHAGVQHSVIDDGLRQLAASGRIVNASSSRNHEWIPAPTTPLPAPPPAAAGPSPSMGNGT